MFQWKDFKLRDSPDWEVRTEKTSPWEGHFLELICGGGNSGSGRFHFPIQFWRGKIRGKLVCVFHGIIGMQRWERSALKEDEKKIIWCESEMKSRDIPLCKFLSLPPNSTPPFWMEKNFRPPLFIIRTLLSGVSSFYALFFMWREKARAVFLYSVCFFLLSLCIWLRITFYRWNFLIHYFLLLDPIYLLLMAMKTSRSWVCWRLCLNELGPRISMGLCCLMGQSKNWATTHRKSRWHQLAIQRFQCGSWVFWRKYLKSKSFSLFSLLDLASQRDELDNIRKIKIKI